MVSTAMKKKTGPSPNLLRALLGLFIVASLSYWIAGSIDIWDLDLHWSRHINAPLTYNDETGVVTAVEPEAKAAGIAPRDKITGLNGAPFTGDAQWIEIVVTGRPGDTLDVEFLRPDGSRGVSTVTLLPHKPVHRGVAKWALLTRDGIVGLLLPLVCLAIGYWVVLAKPLDRNAWLVLILLTFPTALTVDVGMATGIALLLRGFWYQAFQLAAAPALMLFGIYFPERSRLDRRLPWIKWLILAPYPLFVIALAPYLHGQYYTGFVAPRVVYATSLLGRIVNGLNLACIAIYLISTLDKLHSASTADARRRLRVLTAGQVIGVGSLVLVFVVLPHFGFRRDSVSGFWISFLGEVLFMVSPLTLAYVVLVQRAMDVRVILRLGTRYLMARAFLFVLQFVLIALATWRFLAVILILRAGVRKRAQAWLDRKFFREAYDAEVVLSELSDEVRRFTDTEPLLETVARRVAETLHIDQIAMLLRRGECFYLQQAIGVSMQAPLMLPAQASAVRYLSATNEPARLYRDDPDAWYLMAGAGERHLLDLVNAELLVPLPGRNRLMGIMALGPKRSEAAYTPADLHLLQTVATQTGLAIEIAELAHSLANEAAQRERVNREIEIAREVQERLFPQEMPEIPGATVAGHCRPALGVGGDYYDLIDLGDGRVGLAIGDVSGKGIAAALLMASLRASLRGVTLDNPRDFAKLMDKVNRLVYEASASNRYATFFFASFDPRTRQLDCVNAGHNPPIVLRKALDGRTTVIRLEADGPVVGLLPFAPYTEQSITLMPGDLLLLYTDGISEAMTDDDEEWGDDRLIASAEKCLDMSAAQAMQCLFDDADAFTAGAPQHDDMTVMVLKLDA
jgi:sigma-B regulation protein RsbU (phosphoserine phosphatase)